MGGQICSQVGGIFPIPESVQCVQMAAMHATTSTQWRVEEFRRGHYKYYSNRIGMCLELDADPESTNKFKTLHYHLHITKIQVDCYCYCFTVVRCT